MEGDKKFNPTLRLLLTTTELLIREKGCSKITMKDIIEHSGISKGGIYHYVESKEELFSLVLQTHLEQVTAQFWQQLEKKERTESIWIETLFQYVYRLDQDSVCGEILLYLLHKKDQLIVRQTIRNYYRQVVKTTFKWIQSGQQKVGFSTVVDGKKMADLFVLISLGLLLRNVIPSAGGHFTTEDFSKLVEGILRSG